MSCHEHCNCLRDIKHYAANKLILQSVITLVNGSILVLLVSLSVCQDTSSYTAEQILIQFAAINYVTYGVHIVI